MKKKIKGKDIGEDEGENINFYERDDVKVFCPDYHNPNYDVNTMPFKHPMRGILIGASGSGKSNVLLNLIKKMNNTFNSIKIFTQDKKEPLYEYLESVIPAPQLEIFEGIDAFNNYDIKEELKHGQHLLVFDDFVVEGEKKQSKIKELYIRGRKMAENGLSLLYLSQSYYETPKMIRKQATSLILKKINGGKELRTILKDCSVNATGNQLEAMYNHCVKSADDITNFMLIDKTATEDKRFRKNYREILNPADF